MPDVPRDPAKTDRPPQTVSAEELTAELRAFAHWLDSASALAARRLGLPASDYALVGFLVERPEGASPKEIAGHLRLSSGAATALIDRLEAAGFVGRAPHPADRRSVIVRLRADAPPGPVAFHGRVHEIVQGIIGQYDDSERALIARFLGAFTALDPGALLDAFEAEQRRDRP